MSPAGLDFSQLALNGRLVQRHHFHRVSGEFSTWAGGEWVMHKSNDIPGKEKVIESGREVVF